MARGGRRGLGRFSRLPLRSVLPYKLSYRWVTWRKMAVPCPPVIAEGPAAGRPSAGSGQAEAAAHARGCGAAAGPAAARRQARADHCKRPAAAFGTRRLRRSHARHDRRGGLSSPSRSSTATSNRRRRSISRCWNSTGRTCPGFVSKLPPDLPLRELVNNILNMLVRLRRGARATAGPPVPRQRRHRGDPRVPGAYVRGRAQRPRRLPSRPPRLRRQPE